MADNQHEVHVDYLMDIACVRRSPSDEVLDRASTHTTECSLVGHCIESGYALIGDDARLHLLESAPTTGVVQELLPAGVGGGLRLEVIRERDGQGMRTVELRAVAAEGRG